MKGSENPAHPILDDLARAAVAWGDGGDERRLARWLARELDADGVPIRLAVPDWHRALALLGEARRGRGEWPSVCVEAIHGLAMAVLRFSRADGSPSLSSDGGDDAPSIWSSPDWSRWFRGTGIDLVLGWWRGGRAHRRGSSALPSPTWSSAGRVLAMLRPDWSPAGDFLALDHRDSHSPCRLELSGGGRTRLGPTWAGPASRPRPALRLHDSSADLFEWTDRVDGVKITRTALLLRGRHVALIATLAERNGPTWPAGPEQRVAMPAGTAAAPVRDSRALALGQPGRRGAAQVLPIGLPCRPYSTERGSFEAVDGDLVLRRAPEGRRCWLPMLVSWHAERHRKPVDWRVLTITERSRIVPADRAFAARVSWGRDETYVIYRSLGPPGRRTFLGHQTGARFLFAAFDADGDLEPIVTV